MNKININDQTERMRIGNLTRFSWHCYFGDSVYIYSADYKEIVLRRFQRTKGKGFRKVHFVFRKSLYSELEAQLFWATHWRPVLPDLCAELGIDVPLDQQTNTPFPFYRRSNRHRWEIFHHGFLHVFEMEYGYYSRIWANQYGSCYTSEYIPSPLGRSNLTSEDAESYFTLLSWGLIDNILMEDLL